MAAQNHFGDQSIQPTAQKIDQLQLTRDTLTSRGGLTFLVKYAGEANFFEALRSSKGLCGSQSPATLPKNRRSLR
jgi:hypothetical protein